MLPVILKTFEQRKYLFYHDYASAENPLRETRLF